MAVRLAAAAVLGGARARPSIPRLMCAGTANNRLFSFPPRDHRGHCPDYYAVLGLNRAATPRQVKVAYFKRAKKYHPDQNQSDEARLMFQLVAEAYEVLSDERRRRNFDEHGTPGERFGGTTSGLGGPGRARGPDNYDPEELFSKIFGEANAREKAEELEYEDFAANPDSGTESTKEYKITASFEEAALGCDFQLLINVKAICWQCKGTKSQPGYTWNVCVYCDGTGFETEKVGHVLTRHPCSMCGGTKQFIKYKCTKCEGHGVVIQMAQQNIRIPPGSENGQVFKFEVDEKILDFCIPGQQEKYFYVYLTVEDSPHFKKEDLHLHSEADVSLSQALLGGHLVVKGLHKKELWLQVPPLMEQSSSLCAHFEGIPRVSSSASRESRGHHFVHTSLRAPERLTQRQREILLQFARLGEEGREGTVDGMEDEGPEAHKYSKAIVVEPKKVDRPFAKVAREAPRTGKEEAEAEEKMSLWERISGRRHTSSSS